MTRILVMLACLLGACERGEPTHATEVPPAPAPAPAVAARPARPVVVPRALEAPDEPDRACCRHCHKGKACGNSCINRQLTCHKARGCACDE